MPNIEVIIVQDENLKNTSFGSQNTCENIYEVILSKYGNAKVSLCNNFEDLEKIVLRKPDLVVLTNKVMEIEGKRIWLSEYFETHDINYTGSIKEVLKYDVNKIFSKKQIISHGIETACFFTAIPDEFKSLEDLSIPFPLFIKPSSSANSDGIDEGSFVFNFVGFQEKVKKLYETYQEPVLVEEYLPGREFTVSIIKTDIMLIAPIEIIAPLENDMRILSNKVKSQNSEILKEITDIETYKKVSNIAKASFEALGARDFGRIDIKMDSHERCYFIEANLTPGMKQSSSYFPRSYEICSLLKYDEMVNLLVHAAITRH